jgi:uncharacterized membrane protein
VAAIVASFVPARSPIRLLVTLPILLVAPGYLLLQTIAPGPASAGARSLQILLSLGLSPPLVGLLALATAVLPGGFRAGTIVMIVTTVCLMLLIAAAHRRSPRDAEASDWASRATPDAA